MFSRDHTFSLIDEVHSLYRPTFVMEMKVNVDFYLFNYVQLYDCALLLCHIPYRGTLSIATEEMASRFTN